MTSGLEHFALKQTCLGLVKKAPMLPSIAIIVRPKPVNLDNRRNKAYLITEYLRIQFLKSLEHVTV